MKIAIKKSAYGKGHYCIYRGDTLIGTVSNERPTRANDRLSQWCIAWLTGRVEWFDSQKEMRDCALKG